MYIQNTQYEKLNHASLSCVSIFSVCLVTLCGLCIFFVIAAAAAMLKNYAKMPFLLIYFSKRI